MRMKSTGLGKTELVGKLENVNLMEDHLIFSVRTSEPVKWHIRVAIDNKDIKMVFGQLIKLKILKYLLLSLNNKRELKPPANY